VDFSTSDKVRELQDRLGAFMDDHVYPAEPVWREQMQKSGDPHFHPPVVEDLKAEARRQDLWNLFLPDDRYGAGLTNLEYAPLAEAGSNATATTTSSTDASGGPVGLPTHGPRSASSWASPTPTPIPISARAWCWCPWTPPA
jgi:acyl-CoA dehydrogenase